MTRHLNNGNMNHSGQIELALRKFVAPEFIFGGMPFA